jgi:hypothetical protein
MTLEAFVLAHPAGALCGQGTTAQARRDNALRFVNQVALDGQGTYGTLGLLAAPDGTDSSAFGYKPDILTRRISPTQVEHYDIVSASEASYAAPAYQPIGLIDPTRFRDARPDLAVSGPPTPGPDPDPPPQGSLNEVIGKLDLILAKLDRSYAPVG